MKYNDLPVFVFSRASVKMNDDGIYVFTGSGACAASLKIGSAALIAAADTAGIRIIKNRGSATVTITSAASSIYDTTAVTTYDVLAGQGVVLVWDGSVWCVVGKAN
jgi:hypothetical protein